MRIRSSTKKWLFALAAATAAILAAGQAGLPRFLSALLQTLGVLAFCVSALILGVRMMAAVAARLFYRLSWRLAFSYFLIGVLPVPMVAMLLWLVTYMSVGQFEVYRVQQAIEMVGLEMSAAELPGTVHARISGGRIESSTIPGLTAGAPAPDLQALRDARFVRVGENRFLGKVRIRPGAADLFAAPLGDPLYAELALRSGVALEVASLSAELEQSRAGLQVRVDESERKRLESRKDNFIYPPEAMQDDHSRYPWKSATWFYTSSPVISLAGEAGRPSYVALFTRMSWRRALSELFAQGIVGDRRGTWALGALLAVASMLLVVYFVALIIAFVLVRTITDTVNRLSRATAKIGSGDFSVRIATKARDQVGDLARSFDSMAASLEETVEDRAARDRLDREIEQARIIAQNLMPHSDVAVRGLSVETFFEPFAKIGGDYYDFLTTADGRVAVAIGDVSGHGLPTALLVATAKAALAMRLQAGGDGDAVFQSLNRLLHRSTDVRHFMTLSLAIVNADWTLELTNAGHPAPYRISGERVEALELPAFPLGLFPDRPFPTRRYPFRIGDRLVFFSDGIIECRDAADDAFGYDRLEAVLRAGAMSPLSDLRRAVLESVSSHCRSGEFDDDRTLVICERTA